MSGLIAEFNAEMMLELLVIALLATTIGYCGLLHRRLGRFRATKAELETVLRGFADATREAEAGVASLRQVANEAGGELQRRIDEARTLALELRRTANLAAGGGAEPARAMPPDRDRRVPHLVTDNPGNPGVPAPITPQARQPSEAERELLAALASRQDRR